MTAKQKVPVLLAPARADTGWICNVTLVSEAGQMAQFDLTVLAPSLPVAYLRAADAVDTIIRRDHHEQQILAADIAIMRQAGRASRVVIRP